MAKKKVAKKAVNKTPSKAPSQIVIDFGDEKVLSISTKDLRDIQSLHIETNGNNIAFKTSGKIIGYKII